MSRNFGIGSRSMSYAGRLVLDAQAARRLLSFSSVKVYHMRWSLFCDWSAQFGVKRMEDVSWGIVQLYGCEQAVLVDLDEMEPSYAQNLVSAVNSVMSFAIGGGWLSVSPTKDCDIQKRSAVRRSPPGALNWELYIQATIAVANQAGLRELGVVELGRLFGLRPKEASLIDAKKAWREAQSRGYVTIREGTKGGREREVPISSDGQLEALARAAAAQGNDYSMIPVELSWKSWVAGPLRKTRDLVKEATGGGLHDLRAAYACERYAAITGHPAPCAGGRIQDRATDLAARLAIANELGHARVDVVAEYVGGRA